MHRAVDEDILDRADAEGRVVVSADTDFATVLAARHARSPSVILFCHGSQHRPSVQAQLLIENLSHVERPLIEGSVVVIEPARIRVRSLPLLP